MFLLIAIRRLGPDLVESRKKDIPPLIESLRESLAEPDFPPLEKGNRIYVLGALADGCGELAIDAIPLLNTCLEDPNPSVRGTAAYALGYIGPTAKDAIPLLTACLNDSDSYVRAGAGFALKTIAA